MNEIVSLQPAVRQASFTRPAANFIISVRAIKFTQQFRLLGLSLTVIFPSVANETSHNNRCGPLP